MITNSRIATGDQLGAQMTKLAALMHIGIKNNQDLVFWEELKEYKRGFQFLDVFFIDELKLIRRCGSIEKGLIDYYSRDFRHSDNWKRQMKRIYKGKIYSKIDKLMYHSIQRRYLDFEPVTYLQNNVYTDDKLLALDQNKNYDIQNGFGTYRDWGENANIILSRFHFQEWVVKQGETIMKMLPNNKKKIAIHVRMTDYLLMASLNLDEDYYRKAISYFDLEISKFIVFSDDIDECRKMSIFKGLDVCFMNRNKAAVDLYLMTQMDGNIIANSTFSVWGALLNRKTEKVICPHDFVGSHVPEASYINGNYYPNNWIAL